MYYNYRKIDSYNAPINVILSKRGLGKTFGRILRCVKRFVKNGKRFVYVVETEDMVKTLCENNGEKFFASIIKYLEENQSENNKIVLSALLNYKLGDEEFEIKNDKIIKHTKGGAILINNETAGYIVSFNGFAKLKRNNFINISEIIIDEFIPENIDIRSLKNPYKVVNLVQSIARTQNLKIYLLGNTIRRTDSILQKLGCAYMNNGEWRKIKDNYGLILVAHMVDPTEYEEFKELADSSVAGRFSKLLKQDFLEENQFYDEMAGVLHLPKELKPSHLFMCLHGEGGSIRINITKDHSALYILEDYGTNNNKRYCINEKYQTGNIKYLKEWKELLINYWNKQYTFFENENVLLIFKKILGLNVDK